MFSLLSTHAIARFRRSFTPSCNLLTRMSLSTTAGARNETQVRTVPGRESGNLLSSLVTILLLVMAFGFRHVP